MAESGEKNTDKLFELVMNSLTAAWDQMRTAEAMGLGMSAYTSDFLAPFFIALQSFLSVEHDKLISTPLEETWRDYWSLFNFNLQVGEKGYWAGQRNMTDFLIDQTGRYWTAWYESVTGQDPDRLAEFISRRAALLDLVLYQYPQAIKDIEPEYGLHPEQPGYEPAFETDRFNVYQIMPSEPGVKVNPSGKPILIVPPYVLGPNILCFLPGEKKSYVHAYANQGIPVYLRVLKDIQTTEAVQIMNGEDDTLDTKYFCERLMEKHGRPVTLNGFCQGGFVAVLAWLTGELDGLVDALITCVAPMDGTRSKALVDYMKHLPPRFRDLSYAVKPLPSGHQVVDGTVMSWVYKLKSMDKEAPLVTFFRDLKSFDARKGSQPAITKTAAAINHWLIYDRNDLPEAITKLSFDSYTIPVDKHGTLPVKLFGRTLNFGRVAEKGVPWLICYAKGDDLVDAEATLAPTDWVDAEVTAFPKGHGAIATSWSNPDSACALHTVFDGYRGPVRFHLDLG